MFRRLIASIVCITFSFSNLQYVQAANPSDWRDLALGGGFSVNQLPVPGAMIGESASFSPLALKGLVINPQKPLQFQFIVDTGKGPQGTPFIKEEANKLVKYFLAGLTIPEGELWVNLSPYEKNRITTPSLGQTTLGRDLLAQDYILKQLTASLIYPEKDLGKEFWNRIYSKAQQEFGTTNIPVNTFNKVWILPDQAQIYEHGGAAYITRSTLKVMLDEDYLALQKHALAMPSSIRNNNSFRGDKNLPTSKQVDILGANIVREIVIPEITKEVNTGKNFAPLRQIYDAMILAKWYKETFVNGILDAVYTNKNKTAGVNLTDPAVKERIYQRYLQAYKKGVFNYIKEAATPDGQLVPRKYFSGGCNPMPSKVDADGAMTAVKYLSLWALTISLSALQPSGSLFAQQLQQTDVGLIRMLSESQAEVYQTGDILSSIHPGNGITGEDITIAKDSLAIISNWIKEQQGNIDSLQKNKISVSGPELAKKYKTYKNLNLELASINKRVKISKIGRSDVIFLGIVALLFIASLPFVGIFGARNQSDLAQLGQTIKNKSDTDAAMTIVGYILARMAAAKQLVISTPQSRLASLKQKDWELYQQLELELSKIDHQGHGNIEKLFPLAHSFKQHGFGFILKYIPPTTRQVQMGTLELNRHPYYDTKHIEIIPNPGKTAESVGGHVLIVRNEPHMSSLGFATKKTLSDHAMTGQAPKESVGSVIRDIAIWRSNKNVKRIEAMLLASDFRIQRAAIKAINALVTDPQKRLSIFDEVSRDNRIGLGDYTNVLYWVIKGLKKIDDQRSVNLLKYLSSQKIDLYAAEKIYGILDARDAAMASVKTISQTAPNTPVAQALAGLDLGKELLGAGQYGSEYERRIRIIDSQWRVAKKYLEPDNLNILAAFRFVVEGYANLEQLHWEMLVSMAPQKGPHKIHFTFDLLPKIMDSRNHYEAFYKFNGIIRDLSKNIENEIFPSIFKELSITEAQDFLYKEVDKMKSIISSKPQGRGEDDQQRIGIRLLNQQGDYPFIFSNEALPRDAHPDIRDKNSKNADFFNEYVWDIINAIHGKDWKHAADSLKGRHIVFGKTAEVYRRHEKVMELLLDFLQTKDSAMTVAELTIEIARLGLKPGDMFKIKAELANASKSSETRHPYEDTVEFVSFTDEKEDGNGELKVKNRAGLELILHAGTVSPDQDRLVDVNKADLAMAANWNRGGIDLNQIAIKRTGKTIQMQFDPAQLNELEQGGFEGFTPVIINMTRITSPFQLLGVNPPAKEPELLAKA